MLDQYSIHPSCLVKSITQSQQSRNDNKPEECSVCFNDYDDNQLRPRNLPCGHTFCSQCIDNAIKNGQLSCPSCRAEHTATASTQFPISYAVEAFVRKLKNIQLTTEEAVPAKPYEGPARGISKTLRSLVQEQKSIISSLITSCEEVLSQLGEYRGQLGDWKTHHLQLQDRLYALVEQNKSAMKLLELEDTSVVDMTPQGEEGKTQLQAMLGSLDTVTTPQEVGTTIDTADGCKMKVEDWLRKCQELFPDVNTVHTSVKVQETIREALEMTTTETGATADPVHLGDSASSIMNKVKEITGQIPQKQLTVEDLRRMREPVKRLVEAGRVVAVQEDQDGRRSARITLQDGQLYLHPLLRQPTPADAHALQRGHTYRNTKLLWVVDKGQPGERVRGGDYESNDGEGGAPLLPDLQEQYRESDRAGAVCSRSTFILLDFAIGAGTLGKVPSNAQVQCYKAQMTIHYEMLHHLSATDTAIEFYIFFSTIGTSLVNDIPSSQTNVKDYLTAEGTISDIECWDDPRGMGGKKTIEGNQKNSSAQSTTSRHLFVLPKRSREKGTKPHSKGSTREKASEEEREITTKAKGTELGQNMVSPGGVICLLQVKKKTATMEVFAAKAVRI
ncbi:uncharacterized protein [Procambarus clarkii]|uniref:uncharacterized protein n=1 Tax=Procambarus clarkii TaxID=6728 RepID=UPI0037428908